MARNIATEPLLAVDTIQGDILPGLRKRHEHLLFFSIDDPAAFKPFLKDMQITSMATAMAQAALIDARKKAGSDTELPTPGLNVAFTFDGLKRLGVPGLPGDSGTPAPRWAAFQGGMASRHGILNDPPPAQWRVLRPGRRLHGVFIVTGASDAEIADTIALQLSPVPGNGWHILHEERGKVRPPPVRGHEHFGFADGVSQPGVKGRTDATTPLQPLNTTKPDQGQPGQDLLWPGEFVFGYPGQVAGDDFTRQGPDKAPPIPFMANGAFMVFRRLAQLVPEFHAAVKAAAHAIPASADKPSPALLAAQMVGRWRSGASLINAPTADDPGFADGTDKVNDFEFGDDREGLVCPWAAHIRKAYPRDDVPGDISSTADSDKAEADTQTHRMMRRGIAFGPEVTEHEALSGHSDPAHARGLLFKCYVTSLDDQFEFVQQSWVDNKDFSQPNSGIDPIIGQTGSASKPFLGAAPFSKDPSKRPQVSFGNFVRMEGGAYFFAPSIDAIRSL